MQSQTLTRRKSERMQDKTSSNYPQAAGNHNRPTRLLCMLEFGWLDNVVRAATRVLCKGQWHLLHFPHLLGTVRRSHSLLVIGPIETRRARRFLNIHNAFWGCSFIFVVQFTLFVFLLQFALFSGNCRCCNYQIFIVCRPLTGQHSIAVLTESFRMGLNGLNT